MGVGIPAITRKTNMIATDVKLATRPATSAARVVKRMTLRGDNKNVSASSGVLRRMSCISYLFLKSDQIHYTNQCCYTQCYHDRPINKPVIYRTMIGTAWARIKKVA